ncbi:alpha-galactosidase [Trueperella pecoris]|uniref:Alpha-galactosidase n=1 Tax=Trueperella pecoris TaxID=2733571 RepID=A0A7M1R175_9ACTO|nr:glycoside hydrolase family 36 protein [Trueperella pecoris]QOR47896.1 alpha-galactosidase [Trueperella pecoris]
MDIEVGAKSFRLRVADEAVQAWAGHVVVAANSFVINHPWGATEFFRHGWNSWSSTRWWHMAKKPWRVWDNPDRTLTAEDAATDNPQVHTSAMVTALCGPDGEVFLVGALRGESPTLRIDECSVSCTADSDALWFIATGLEVEVFSDYVAALAQERGLQSLPRVGATIGPIWSSWYSWFEEITDEIISAEISPARELGYGSIQIDDGWESRVGNWSPNDKFPAGMADLSGRIHDAGLKTGLWVAPFIALPGTPVLERYPQMFLKDAHGELLPVGHNWGEHYYGLDFSRPDAHEWLAETMTEIAGWGIDMFKLDFIYAAALEAERVGMGREEAYRAGLVTIREAVGPDVYLLGSGAVINASFGLLNGVRVGPDTAPYWDNTERKGDPTGPSVLNALRSSLSRTWLRPLIDCDPDVAYFRTRGSLLSPEVNELTADASLACEFAQCSDPAAWLSDDERGQVRRWAENARRAPDVVQTGRYTYTIDGREVDFDTYLNPTGRVSDRLLVK